MPRDVALLLADFPADEMADVLAPLRSAGLIVRDREVVGQIEYETTVAGQRFVGRGSTDEDAARALLMSYAHSNR